ncbi:hypothetical protein [Gluconobacter cerinus]|uniref:hypothetical protein n=1 Tax=Gluconobacter cerinus TaxID=38307 RepID=UPI001B8D0D01|nr:hypothetical protein [Gluconobacter cerinus]MBS1026521.1 hypothetical protein [Gluconobacter cerinus]
MILNKFYKKRTDIAVLIVSNIRECNSALSEIQLIENKQEKLNLEKRANTLLKIYIDFLERLNSKEYIKEFSDYLEEEKKERKDIYEKHFQICERYFKYVSWIIYSSTMMFIVNKIEKQTNKHTGIFSKNLSKKHIDEIVLVLKTINFIINNLSFYIIYLLFMIGVIIIYGCLSKKVSSIETEVKIYFCGRYLKDDGGYGLNFIHDLFKVLNFIFFIISFFVCFFALPILLKKLVK